MSINSKLVLVLFILHISLVVVLPKTIRLLPDTGDSEVQIPGPEEEDDDLTRHSLTRLRVDGPAAEVVQQQDKLLQRRRQQARQDDDDDETTARPEIPAIIPGVTKIVNGLLTGSINDIFHGAFSFAPKNVTYGINTVYNSVVGLPPPTRATTPRPLSSATSAATVAAAATTVEAEDSDGGSDEDSDALLSKDRRNKIDNHYY